MKAGPERRACDPPLRVYLCGRPAIEVGALVVREADLPGRQGRRLWVYLSMHRRGPVGRDELAEAICGDDIPDAWDTTLNSLASRLRRALAPLAEIAPGLAIWGEPGRYALALPAGSFVDWERARDAIHEADRLVFGGDPGRSTGRGAGGDGEHGARIPPRRRRPWVGISATTAKDRAGQMPGALLLPSKRRAD